jgi:cytochrome c oxidase subunit 2
MLDPNGPSARAIAAVWWWMFGFATLVFLAVLALWGYALWRGRRDRPPALGEDGRSQRRWIIGGGILLPALSSLALVLFGSPSGLHQLPLPGRGGPEPLQVEVTAHRWYWDVYYPATGLRLRDELRLPVGRPADIQVTSQDVIHSFWVPRLGGKLDAIPGRKLRLRLQADAPGSFRGQCAEFCGVGHAHMVMAVHALPAAEFEAWLFGAPATAAAGATR